MLVCTISNCLFEWLQSWHVWTLRLLDRATELEEDLNNWRYEISHAFIFHHINQSCPLSENRETNGYQSLGRWQSKARWRGWLVEGALAMWSLHVWDPSHAPWSCQVSVVGHDPVGMFLEIQANCRKFPSQVFGDQKQRETVGKPHLNGPAASNYTVQGWFNAAVFLHLPDFHLCVSDSLFIALIHRLLLLFFDVWVVDGGVCPNFRAVLINSKMFMI